MAGADWDRPPVTGTEPRDKMLAEAPSAERAKEPAQKSALPQDSPAPNGAGNDSLDGLKPGQWNETPMRQEDEGSGYFLMAAFIAFCGMVFFMFMRLITYSRGGPFLDLAIPLGFGLAVTATSIPILRYLNRFRTAEADSGYFKAANLFALFSAVSFILVRLPEYLSKGLYFNAAVNLLFCLAGLIIMVFLMRFAVKVVRLAFFIPLCMFCIYTVGTVLMGGSTYYFSVYLVICGIGAVYNDFRRLITFCLFSDIVIGILLLNDMPILSRGPASDDAMVNWMIAVYSTVFLLMLSRFSTDKSSRSAKAMDTFSTLMATTPNFMVLIDELNQVTYISKPLAELARIEDHRMSLGRPILDLFREMEMKLMISDILDSRGFFQATRTLNLDGRVRHFKIISDSLAGQARGRFIDFSDVSEIVAARLEAEESSAAKSAFLAKMSHEIRTPMNAITGMSELILRVDLPAEVREYAMEVKQASQNLLSVINDILDFSKIESGKMEIVAAEYEFSSLINDVIAIIRIRLLEKPILFAVNIDCRLPSRMVGDEVHLRQILLNLLSNAVKYTNSGEISLAVMARFAEGSLLEVICQVADTGIGIKEEDMARLFDDFTQFDSHRNRGVEGTGLGLTIARSLCRAMGGDILVSSQYGQGSVFTATFLQTAASDRPVAQVEDPARKRVLLFGRREFYANSLCLSLSDLGVPHAWVRDRAAFREALSESGESPVAFVIVSKEWLEEAREDLENSGQSPALVLLTEFGEVISRQNVRSLHMPAHSASLANLLNDREESRRYGPDQSLSDYFLAPQARILVVDDIRTNLRVAEGLLAPYRSMVDTCGSGQESIALARENAYDLILMDHMMPGMDGIEAAQAIRALSQGPCRDAPIVALTANAVSGMREFFLANGFDDYIAKPVEISKLAEVMDRWIPESKRARAPVRDTGQSGRSWGGLYGLYRNGSFSQGFPAPGQVGYATFMEFWAQRAPAFPLSELLAIEGLDAWKGLSMAGDKPEAYMKILASFCQDAYERLPLLAGLPKPEGLKLFTIQAHALKGAAASIGAQALSQSLAKLEACSGSGDLEGVGEILGPCRDGLAAMLESLKGALAAGQALREAELGSRGEALSLGREDLLRLKEALEKEMLGEADRLVERLSSLAPSFALDRLSAISDRILMYELAEAVSITESLLAETP
jgi:signal transduction histidine kinase/HPt (histidine-containing phosphotransfer) domain-containing protein/AmiR/NasT family two-component response regulator